MPPQRTAKWRKRQWTALAILLAAAVLIGVPIARISYLRTAAVAGITQSDILQRAQHQVESRNQAAREHYEKPSAGAQPVASQPASTPRHYTDNLGNTPIDAIARLLSEGENLELFSKYPNLSDSDKAKLAQFLIDHQDILAQLRALGAAGVPWYQLDLSKGYETLLPHLAPMRHFTRLLAAQCALDLEHGRADLAFENLRAIYQVGEILAGEPVLISQLVRNAIGSIAFDQLQKFPPGSLSSSQRQELNALLAGMEFQSSYSDSLYSEGSSGLMIFEQVRQGRHVSELDPLLHNDFLMTIYTSPIARPWFNLDEGEYAETMQQFAALAEIPYYQAIPSLDAAVARIDGLPATRVFTHTLAPAIERVHQSAAESTARVQIAQAALQVEQYHASHGAYPDTLAAAGVTSVDPFTGQNYPYTHGDDGFQIYSVGRNRVDDGGRHDTRTGDIVWQSPAP